MGATSGSLDHWSEPPFSRHAQTWLCSIVGRDDRVGAKSCEHRLRKNTSFYPGGPPEPGTLGSGAGGRFISEAWNVQVYRYIPNPKSSYVADWEELPEWQRKTDMDIYSAIAVEVSRGQAVDDCIDKTR